MFPMRGSRGRNGEAGPVNNFRIALDASEPVPSADKSTDTIWLLPWNGDKLAIVDNGSRKIVTPDVTHVTVAGLTAGKNYDVVWDPATNSIALAAAWTNDTARSYLTERIKGMLVGTGDGRRILGTVRAVGAASLEDSITKRWLWNMDNRVERHMFVADPTDNWVYGTGAWRPTNNSTGNRVDYLVGLDEDLVVAAVYSMLQHVNTTTVGVGVGVDSTTVNSAQTQGGTCPAAGWANPAATYQGRPGIGRHYLQQLENGGGNGNATWYGTHSGAVMGMWARVKA